MAKAKIPVQVRLSEDVVQRIDEAAQILDMSRSKYCAYVLSISHSESVNPKSVAMQMVEKATEE